MSPEERRLKELVLGARRIAIVGLSPRHDRPSNRVARYLQRSGFTIVPVNPSDGSVILGEPVHPNLETASAVAGPIDLVDVFRRSELVPALLPALLQTRPRLVWLQEGIRDEETARRLEDAEITVVMDRCLMEFHSLLGV
jgi:predicted CoA-binding protein